MDDVVHQVIDVFAAAGPRKDRTAVLVELTKSICPVCKRNVDAQIILEDNRLYMEKQCREHGKFKALLLNDAQWYFDSLKFNKPGAIPLHFNSQVHDGCPEDCGICPNHQQHTCLAILEITQRCNLRCEQCFAGSEKNGQDLTLEEATKRVDNLVKCEGKAEVLQISGGEPTLHPQLMDIIHMVKSRDVQSVMLNTNGIRIAQDRELAARLAEIRPTPPSVYLQFDDFKDSFYQEFRGRALLEMKLKAIENLSEHGLKIALVATIIQGKNDDQIGKICDFAVKHQNIRTVNFQPVFYEGRIPGEFDPMNRITLTDVFQKAEEQTGGMLRKSDFIPVPCPFPSCSGLTYIYYEDGKATPITRLIDVEDYLDFLKNRTMLHLSEDIFGALKSFFSFSVEGGSLDMVESFCTACGISLPRIDSIAERVTMIGAMSFMDGHTFDWKRAMKCCIHELAGSDRIVPFCVYNNIYRDVSCGGFQAGGRVGLNDVILNEELPDKWKNHISHILCLADAQSFDGYIGFLNSAGFSDLKGFDESRVFADLANQIKAKLLLAQLAVGLGKLNIPNFNIKKANQAIKEVLECIQAKKAGYGMILGRKSADG